ncbi:hypothetical protein ACOMHN_059723 [Nucella lapillus]
MLWKKNMGDTKLPPKTFAQGIPLILLLALLCGTAMLQSPQPPNPTLTSKLFGLLPSKDLRFKHRKLGEAPARSRGECGVQCLGAACCAMFTFWPVGQTSGGGGTCRLHARAVLGATSNSSAPGARSYALIKELCAITSYTRWCGACFSMLASNLTYSVAKTKCQNPNMGKVPITRTTKDMDTVVAFTQLADPTCQLLWVGAERKTDGFQWVTGLPLESSSPLWSPSHPREVSQENSPDCVVLHTGSARLLSVPCTALQASVCVVCQWEDPQPVH